jgi:uncharacterized membrane protein
MGGLIGLWLLLALFLVVLAPFLFAELLAASIVARTTTGIASIGGAGTFDGIVLSGVIAAYLA